MAVKKKIINIRVYFDGDQDAKEVFAEVIAQKIRDTKTISFRMKIDKRL